MQGRTLVPSEVFRVVHSDGPSSVGGVAGCRSQVVHGVPRLAERVALRVPPRVSSRVALRIRQTCLSTTHDDKARFRGFLSLRSHPAVQMNDGQVPIRDRLPAPGRPLGLERGGFRDARIRMFHGIGSLVSTGEVFKGFEGHHQLLNPTFKNWPCRTC